jgi:hypothetical protein
MAEARFDFKNFVEESKATLLRPVEYFTSMRKEGGLAEPVLKTLIYGLAAGVLTYLWLLVGLRTPGSMLHGVIGGAGGFLTILTTPLAAVVTMFLGAVLILALSAVCGGETSFEPCARVAASLAVLSPLGAALNLSWALGATFGGIVDLAVNVLGIWLWHKAQVHALGGKPNAAKVVAVILAVLLVLSALAGSRSMRGMTGV